MWENRPLWSSMSTGQERDLKPRTYGLRLQHSQLSNLLSKPAPTIRAMVTSLNGQVGFDVLPDSGADICAAGPHFVQVIGEHIDNLASSNVAPKTASGHHMHPLGKLLNVRFDVEGRSTTEDVHTYRGVSGAWAASRRLGILPDQYPTPLPRRMCRGSSTVCQPTQMSLGKRSWRSSQACLRWPNTDNAW